MVTGIFNPLQRFGACPGRSIATAPLVSKTRQRLGVSAFPRHALSVLRAVAAAFGLCLLVACAGGQAGNGGAPTAPAAPKPDYATPGDHFAALQRAGLTANYADFARHLKATDAKAVTDALQRSFRSGPFDVYTRKSSEADSQFRRLVELRSTSGRLYLYVAMSRVPGGWILAGHQLDRKRDVIMARL